VPMSVKLKITIATITLAFLHLHCGNLGNSLFAPQGIAANNPNITKLLSKLSSKKNPNAQQQQLINTIISAIAANSSLPLIQIPGMPVDVDGNSSIDGTTTDADGDGIVDGLDTNKDGVLDLFLLDANNDSVPDGIDYNGDLAADYKIVLNGLATTVADFSGSGIFFLDSNGDSIMEGFDNNADSVTDAFINTNLMLAYSTPSAGTYSSDQNVALASWVTGAQIFYTTNGSSPTAKSTAYTAPISIAGNGAAKTIKALVIKNGMTGGISSLAFSINYSQVSTPSFSPIGGNYTQNQSVTIASTTGASIYYTTDGSAPSASSTLYTAPILVSGNNTTTTLKAIAMKTGMADSTVAAATYTIALPTVATPVATPPGGSYSKNLQITLSSNTTGAVVYYTTDGSKPGLSSQVYTSPISLSSNGSTLVIRAFAVKSGMADSGEFNASYTIDYTAGQSTAPCTFGTDLFNNGCTFK